MTQTAVETNSKFWYARNPGEWVPFKWDEPAYGGTHVAGEIVLARDGSATGTHLAGFWRGGATSPGCEPDGSCTVKYSAPLGDECLIVLEGEATVTVVKTGAKHHLTPGTIMCHPKGLELLWETKAPYFRKYFVIWDSDKTAATPSEELIFGNINDDPEEWDAYEFDEPVEGKQVQGELYFIKRGGTTGTLWAGIWRSGVGKPGTNPDGSACVPYTSIYGDETEFLLEGRVHVRNDETGEEYEAQRGDILGFTPGVHMTWSPKPGFMKKFWVITNEQLLEV